MPKADDEERQRTLALYQHLLRIRHQSIIPRLDGAQALGAQVLATGAVAARWRMGDHSVLHIALNLSAQAVPYSAPAESEVLYQTPPQLLAHLREHGLLAPYSALVALVRSPYHPTSLESAHE